MIPCFLLGSLVAYFLVTIIYRVHIHPLSKFPGPRLAALTGLYEIYFAAWGTGSFEDEIERMHEKYGQCPFLSLSVPLPRKAPAVVLSC